MIKALKVMSEPITMNLEIDCHVPITIKFPCNDNVFDDIIYVMLANSCNELIELKVNKKTGKLLGIILVMANKIDLLNKNNEYLLEEKIKDYGNIIFEIDGSSKNNYYKYKSNFVLGYKSNKVIIYNPLANKQYKIKMGEVIILIDENKLFSGFIVENLTDDNLNELKRFFVK